MPLLTRSRLAHGLTSAGMSFGVNQAAAGHITWPVMAAGLAVPVAVGAAWEFLLQPLVAKAFPRWDPKPNKMQVLDWVVGAALGSLVSAIL